ncbi:hypothetical protein LMH87_003253 [Akanthomyces muscarius]|uniref:Putative lipoate-protein ligase A n=1 Tax=Akanthomyces muscarius TaxID=2231603 RepID=A0A9W8Q2Z2_AKAMU|nr:hypothetical protein LMH87_003253 [Akanthomyces muscarius]KAJ4144369.1 hypothetical protein LMH87_003253 [Akanthomyces muscarius]
MMAPRASPLPRQLFSLLSRRPRHHHHFSTAAAADPASKTQIYLSRSRDPLLNLSVEHHLLQTAPADATVLMLYANAPCVVFGRNQNPWIETNLARLATTPIRLVRRRSGGGTVFHDEGNVNFSVICPSAAFDRNKHAEMVVRALRRLGRPTTRVNERHDIVIDTPPPDRVGTYKVSGSAYKLTRLRSLHHGTCLLRSPNLGAISSLLRSPAEGFIKARGVDSVRSPVRNLDLDVAAFQDAVVREFEAMYGPSDVRAVVDDAPAMAVDRIRQGYEEMRARDWLYGQTPRFAFCTHPTEEDPRPRPKLPFEQERIHFEAKQGIVERFHVENNKGARKDLSSLVGATMYNIRDWSAQLADAGVASQQARHIGDWLNGILGTAFTKP